MHSIVTFIKNDFVPFIEGQVMTKMHSYEGDALKITSDYLLKKSTKSLKAICELCTMDYGEDALVLGRTVFENSLTLAFIYKPESVELKDCFANLFILHYLSDQDKIKKDLEELKKKGKCREWIDKLENGESLQELVTANHEKDKTLRKRNHFVKKAQKYISERIQIELRKDTWNLLSIKNTALLVGEPYECYYHFVYWSLSKHVHPSVLGSYSYYGKSTQQDEFGECGRSLIISFDCYWRIVYTVNKIYDLGLENKIKEYEGTYVKLF